MDFTNKKIAIIGAGVEGISSALFLKKQGAKVSVLDRRPKHELEKEAQRLKELGIEILFGEDYLKHLIDFEVVVRSPGIKRDIKPIRDAEERGVIITSQIKLFFDLCPAKIIGVTGTKGKGTSSALIYEMLKMQGIDAYLGGNIGKPPLDFLDTLNTQSVVILELSSYQLQDLSKSPHIAVMLMVTSEHLAPDKGLGGQENFHPDLYDYIEAKRNILRFQTEKDFAIVNRDYPPSHESDIFTQAAVYQVSTEREVIDRGSFIKENAVWIRRFDRDQKIIDISEIVLPGKHNLENVCASVIAATLAGVSKENIYYVLKTFKGLEHRLELVDTINNIRFYDDSFSTTPETAIAAINAFHEPEVIILGGAHKNSNFEELGKVIAQSKNIRAIVGIGIEWVRIKEEIEKHNKAIFMVEGAKSMKAIVAAASKIAQPGDVVLLTPACSSFDMFQNYKERGDLFKEEVRKLKQEA